MATKVSKLKFSNEQLSKAIDEMKEIDGVTVDLRQGDASYITIFERFKLSTRFFEEVESRLMRALPLLDPESAYTVGELSIGEPFSTPEFNTAPWVVLCLKHIAAQPNPIIEELRWGTFRRTTEKVATVFH